MLWVAFAVVHIGVAFLGFAMPNQPMGDVYLVYEKWSREWLNGGYDGVDYVGLVGITTKWVYPQLALLPMIFANGFSWIAGYTVGWAILVTAADAAAFGILIGRGRSAGRNVGGWFWLAFIALLGPVGMYRLDGFTVPLVLAGSLWLVGRPWLGSILLATATWMKVWPAALLVAAFMAVRRRMAIVGGALVVSVITLGAVIAAGGGAFALGFVSDQTGRGLQIEAPISTLYMWQAAWFMPGSWVYYSSDMLTFQVTGPFVDEVIAIMTPLLALAVGSVAVLGAYKAWRGASFVRLFPPLALGLVLAFIVFNKVGSPQYVTWLIAPLVVGLVIDRHSWWKPASLGLGIALATQAIYPLGYGLIMLTNPEPIGVALLALRNLMLIVLLVWSVVRLVRIPSHRRSPLPAHAKPVTVGS